MKGYNEVSAKTANELCYWVIEIPLRGANEMHIHRDKDNWSWTVFYK